MLYRQENVLWDVFTLCSPLIKILTNHSEVVEGALAACGASTSTRTASPAGWTWPHYRVLDVYVYQILRHKLFFFHLTKRRHK